MNLDIILRDPSRDIKFALDRCAATFPPAAPYPSMLDLSMPSRLLPLCCLSRSIPTRDKLFTREFVREFVREFSREFVRDFSREFIRGFIREFIGGVWFCV